MKLSKICFVLIVFALFLVLPQISLSEYVFATITSKHICFLYSCLALIIFYTIYVVSAKNLIFSLTKLDVVLFALLTYITINRYVIQTDFGFSIRFIELVGLSFLYVALRSIALKNYSWLLLFVVVSGIIQAVYGNLQLLGFYPSNHSGFRMTGSFFNPGPYAGFLVSVWPVALGMYLFKDSITTQVQSQTKNYSPFLSELIKQAFEYIPLLGLISIAIVIPATQSRAAWLAAIICSLFLVELKYSILKTLFKKIKTFKGIALIILSIGILCAGLLSVYHFKKNSSDGRAFIWKVSSEMIADHPVFGVGFDRFKAHYMNYQAHYFTENGETQEAMVADNTYYAFNEWLQFVIENGFLGFVFLMIAGLVLFKIKVKEEYKILSLIAKIGLLAIGVFASFSYPMQILPIKLVLVFIVAMLSNSDAEPYQLKSRKVGKTLQIYKTVILIVGIIGINKTINYTKNLDYGFIIWENALIKYQYGDYKEAIIIYESVYPVFKKDGDFLMNYGKALVMGGEYAKGIVVLEQARQYLNTTVIVGTLGDSYKALHQYDKAEVAYKRAINMIPSKFYAQYLLTRLYDDSGQVDKALRMARKLLIKEVKIPSTAIKEMQEEMKNILIKYKKPLGFKN